MGWWGAVLAPAAAVAAPAQDVLAVRPAATTVRADAPAPCGAATEWVIGGCTNDRQRPCTTSDDCNGGGICMGARADAVGYRKWQPTWPVDAVPGGQEDGPVVLVDRTFYDDAYTVENAFMRWDTSSLPPDAVICRAWIDLFEQSSDNEASGFGVVELDWGYTQRPVTENMWSSSTETGNAATWNVPHWQVGWQRIELRNLDQISRTGYTGVRLRYVGNRPADINDFEFGAWGQSKSAGPILHVEWSRPVRGLPQSHVSDQHGGKPAAHPAL
jgi:hypothetical protein